MTLTRAGGPPIAAASLRERSIIGPHRGDPFTPEGITAIAATDGREAFYVIDPDPRPSPGATWRPGRQVEAWALIGDEVVGLVLDDTGTLVRADALEACTFDHTAEIGEGIGYVQTVGTFAGYRRSAGRGRRGRLRAVA